MLSVVNYKLIFVLISILSITFYGLAKYRYELQMMQQNSYRNERYIKWFRKNIFNYIRISEIIIFSVVIIIFAFEKNIIALIISIVATSLLGIILFTKKQKLKLVFTKRAMRLFSTNLIIVLIINIHSGLLLNILLLNFLVTFSTLIFSFLIIILSNIILKPVETKINQWYYNDAYKLLKQMPDLIIIGITGSYGKTSTKHFLHRILSEKYNVLMTPGSYNTTMGVIRTIREQLKPTHQIFIVEMGAKQFGDIKEICDLVSPQIGILTAVGEQHLDTFKTIENVRKTKFELIDALPQNGLAVLNADYEHIYNTKISNTKTIYYSINKQETKYSLKNINYSKKGSEFSIAENNKDKKSCQTTSKLSDNFNKMSDNFYETKLVGNYNLSNILAVYIVARHLKVPDNKISYAIKKLKPVEHRLEIKNHNGITVIDDAFNSNPVGAKMALNVLKNIAGNRKIIITPGMIELADKHEHYNMKFGEQIAEVCDYVVLVGKKITRPIQKGLDNKKYPQENIFIANKLAEAVKHIQSIVKPNDVLLYENDLPDTYE